MLYHTFIKSLVWKLISPYSVILKWLKNSAWKKGEYLLNPDWFILILINNYVFINQFINTDLPYKNP